MLPVGFTLLLLQAFSELIKRFAFLKGLIDDPTAKKGKKSAEEELAEEIRRLAEANANAKAPREPIIMLQAIINNMAPDHVRGPDRLPAVRLPGGIQPRCLRVVLRLRRHRTGNPARVAAAGVAVADFGIMKNETLLAIPFFTP